MGQSLVVATATFRLTDNSVSNQSNSLKKFIFVHLLLLEDYEQGALEKELIIVTFVEQFKTAPLRKSQQIIFISALSKLVKSFIFVDFLLIEDHEQGALRKECVTALFIKRLSSNRYFEKVLPITSINTQSNLFNHFVLADFFLIKGYEQDALLKKLIIAPLMEWFKTATLRYS